MMFPLLYGGSLCVIGGLALVAVAVMTSALQRKHARILEALRSGHWRGHAALVESHQNEIAQWRERYRRVAGRCKELERELTEIKLGTAAAGYTFDQVPARTIPARIRLTKARTL